MNRLLSRCLVLASFVFAVEVHAAKRSKITVYTETARDYRRETLPDGTPKPIPYAIAFKPSFRLSSDAHIRSGEFARSLSEALLENLATVGLVLASDGASAEQLLVVRAGTTIVPPEARFSTGRQFDDLSLLGHYDALSSPATSMLGYEAGLRHANGLSGTVTGQTLLQELDEELSEPRHYIVIFAYAFDKTAENPVSRFLWRAHVNVEADGPPFADRLDTMLAASSRYFGSNTGRLIRDYRAEVQIGEATVIEDEVPTDSGTAP